MAKLKFYRAIASDAQEIAALHNCATQRLLEKFGHGPWNTETTEKQVLRSINVPTHLAYILIARDGGKIVGTLRLATKKPWAIDLGYFGSCGKSLYLTSMAVAPERQGRGVGRRCIAEAERIARTWPQPIHSIRLDAYNLPAGAGAFYAKCGFREVGRVTYRKTPLIYFELILD